MEEIIDRLKLNFMVATDKDLRDEIGVKRPTFDLWKKNKKIPDRVMMKICKEYGFNLEWLKTGEEPKYMKYAGKAS